MMASTMSAEDNEDHWLYSSSNPPPPEDAPMAESPSAAATDRDAKLSAAEDSSQPTEQIEESTNTDGEDGKLEINEDGDKDGDNKDASANDTILEDMEDDSDDDVNVVIRDIAAPSSYSGFKISKGTTQFGAPAAADKAKNQGNFAINEFDSVGTINGVPAQEFNLDSLEDKPWRKPGADITDYFNYGFTEDTWRAYCERQKRMRLNESGVGIANLPLKPFQTAVVERHAPKSAPPPVRRFNQGTIDVIGGSAPSRRGFEGTPGGDPAPQAANFSLPPPIAPPVPSYSAPPPGFGFNPPPAAPPPPFYEPPGFGRGGQAWSSAPPPPPQGWPGGGTGLPPPPVPAPAPVPVPEPLLPPGALTPSQESLDRERERERDRDRDRERDRDRDRDRERDREQYTPSGAGRTEAWSPDPVPPPPPPQPRDRDRERDRDRDRDRERDRERERERERDRDRDSSRHHRRRSRSRSRERSRRHRSRSRSPSHRHTRSKKNKKKDKNDPE